ncbi:hypothetical protein ACC713_37840, partial [Rhizobium johnstonii]
MEYDPHYPTILPDPIALPLVFVLNILIPVSAIFIARKLQRRRLLPPACMFFPARGAMHCLRQDACV